MSSKLENRLSRTSLLHGLLANAFQKTRGSKMAADAKDEMQYKCICDRPARGILCRICGYFFTGHVRRSCDDHKSSILLMDTDCCPKCFSDHIEEMVVLPRSEVEEIPSEDLEQTGGKTEKEFKVDGEDASVSNVQGQIHGKSVQVVREGVEIVKSVVAERKDGKLSELGMDTLEAARGRLGIVRPESDLYMGGSR